MSARLRHVVGAAVQQHHLWEPSHRVVVAVSGGLDSICLLHLLARTRRWHRAVLEVATVDHGLRPGSSRDSALALEQASELDLPATCLQLNLPPGSSHARSRQARYRALRSLGADRIALAHHRDDQVETVLAHLLRGTGLRGLAGMPWRRGDLVRPLLSTSRSRLQRYAREQGLRWREDPSNSDPRYQRSRLRQELIPALERVRPGARARIASVATRLAEDAALLDDLAIREHARLGPASRGWPLQDLVALPPALQRRVIRRADPALLHAHVEAVLSIAHRGAGGVQLPAGSLARVRGGRLFLRSSTPSKPEHNGPGVAHPRPPTPPSGADVSE